MRKQVIMNEKSIGESSSAGTFDISALTGATIGSVTILQNTKSGDSSSAKNPSRALPIRSQVIAVRKKFTVPATT